MMPAFDEDALRCAIVTVQDRFRAALTEPFVTDLAFIGNTSGVYRWDPCPIIDIDICLWVLVKDRILGEWLLGAERDLRADLAQRGLDFVLKVIRGPFKPPVAHPDRPVAVAHLAVFTEDEYRLAPLAMRYTWRKYTCVADPDRLARLAPSAIPLDDLRETLSRKLERLDRGEAEMSEWVLPAFELRSLRISLDDPAFTEYCVASSMICARNHARYLGRPEADTLPNLEFFPWYLAQVIPSAALRRLMEIKEVLRADGFTDQMQESRSLAREFLSELRDRLLREHPVGAAPE